MKNDFIKMPVRMVLVAAIAMVSFTMMGQLSRPGSPFPLIYEELQYPAPIEFQVSEEEKANLMMTGSTFLKPARSGLLIDTDYSSSNAGAWQTLKDGTKVWRVAFRVRGATSLSLICNPFHLEPGVKVFLFDPSQQNILGAFTNLNNKVNGVLSTSYIPGEILILEIQVPHYLESPGSFTISQIGCDFAAGSSFKALKDGWFGISGDCNEDINCPGNESYKTIKNAVVRIVFSGNERCSGTLINNTLQDGKAYVLTAGHCIPSETVANTALFYFSYESPYCSGPDGNSLKSISGATLRATGVKLDFSLLELLEPVPFLYHAYYAGWDITENVPPAVYSIHHPLGDVKKISKENDPVKIATFDNEFTSNTHWLVSAWDAGTTEAGSSGAGLFDASYLIRGSLTGGQAKCGNSVNDYFQMISHSWKDNDTPENQLSYWLDPLNQDIQELSGLDLYEEFWESGDTLSNIMPAELLKFEDAGLSWGRLSGHNSLHFNQFAEHFTQGQSSKALGIILHVADNYVASATSRLIVKIWPGDLSPGTAAYEKEVKLADFSSGTMNFIEFDSLVNLDKTFFAGYELFYDSPADTFSTYMAENRISTGQQNTAYVYDNQWHTLTSMTGGQVYSSFSVFPVVFTSVPQEDPPLDFTGNVIAYPNPATRELFIEFKEMVSSPVHLTISNIQGQIITDLNYGTYQNLIKLNTSNLSTGIYILTVAQGQQISNLKIFIFK